MKVDMSRQCGSNGKFFKSNLKAFDLYGQPLQLSMRDEQFFSTPIGIIVSLGIVITCLIVFYNDFLGVIYQKRPLLSSSESINYETDPVYLSHENYTMAILITNAKLKAFAGLGTIYNIKVNQCVRNRVDDQGNKINATEVCTSLQIESCKLGVQLVTPQQQTFFQNFDLSHLYCISPNQTTNNSLRLQGTGSANRFSYIRVLVSQCNNATSNNTCQPIEVINSLLSNGNYVVYMLDNVIDQNQADNPYQMITSLYYTPCSNSMTKSIATQYVQSFTQTDNGLVTTNQNITGALIYHGQQEYNLLSTPNFFISHIIALDPKQIVYFRSYKKLQNVFGSLGGLLNVLYFSFFVLMSPLVKKLMYLQIINKIFTFDEGESKEFIPRDGSSIKQRKDEISDSTIIKIDRKKGKKKSTRFGVIKQKNQIEKLTTIKKITNSDEIRKYLKHKQNSLNIGLKSVIALVFCCSLKKQKAQIDYGEKKVVQKLDVFYIIRKLYELEKLKNVLLNEDQQKLFNYQPKPCIPKDLHLCNQSDQRKKVIDSYESKSQYKTFLEEAQTQVQRVTNAYDAYKKIQQSTKRTILDQKLVLLLDRDISSLFDKLMDQEDDISFGARLNQEVLRKNSNEDQEIILYDDGPKHSEDLKDNEVVDPAIQSPVHSPLNLNKRWVQVSFKDDKIRISEPS